MSLAAGPLANRKRPGAPPLAFRVVTARRSVLLLCDESRGHAENVLEHIDALATLSEHDVYRFNPLKRPDACRLLDLGEFDAVVIHYSISLVSPRYLPPPLPERLARFEGLKVQFIQDEYRAVDAVTAAMRNLGVDVLFTCVPEPAAGQIYDSRLPGVTRVFTLPGYVPDKLVGRDVPPAAERPVDVGYRGRDVPVWLGRLGREKTDIAREFLEHVAGTGLRCDISSREDDRIYGEGWNRFLASCRTTLGTESGASIVDFDGSIEALCKSYLARRPEATPEELERDLTGPYEGTVVINTASPRLFEAAALRTAMILFRGTYGGVVEPGRHYLPLDKDLSNIEEVVERVRDAAYLDELAGRAYDDLVASGRYSLRAMVGEFDAVVAERARPVGRQGKDGYRRASGRLRIPNLAGPSRLRTGAGGLLGPLVAAVHTAADGDLRRVARAGLRIKSLGPDLQRLTMLRRGVARSTFHVVAEVVPEEQLLLLSSRPGPAPAQALDARETVSSALAADELKRIVWNHTAVSVAASAGGGSLFALAVGHDGVDGVYAFRALPALARVQPDVVLDALEPMLRDAAPATGQTVGVEA
jgi:hypothetical protein